MFLGIAQINIRGLVERGKIERGEASYVVARHGKLSKQAGAIPFVSWEVVAP